MAAKSSKAKTENQETGVDKVSTPAQMHQNLLKPRKSRQKARIQRETVTFRFQKNRKCLLQRVQSCTLRNSTRQGINSR